MEIPTSFIKYFFIDRIEVLKKICLEGRYPENFLIGFTRAVPAVITYGPAGLSGSIKMVGFVPKKEFINEMADKVYKYAYIDRGKDMRDITCLLLKEFYRIELIDPMLIGGLEMAFRHSWENIRATGKATLLFYTPPNTSYEVRCDVEIYEEDSDPYKKYLNSMHDIFHWSGRKSNYPAYIFKIKEIYDNSNSRGGFGRRIYP